MSDAGPDIWIGIADAIPIDPEEDADVGGAFVHVLAPADNLLEFRAAATEALLEVGFRMAGLDEAERVRDRVRTGGDVAPNLLELAFDAALERETQLGVFYSYPRKDHPDPDAFEQRGIEASREELRLASASRELVTVGGMHEWHSTIGYAAGVGERWALIQLVDRCGQADGFRAVALERVSELVPVDPEESFLPRLLAARPLTTRLPDVDLDTARGLLADAQRLSGLVYVATEDMLPGAFWVGSIAELGEDGVLLRTVSGTGEWSHDEHCPYDAITRVGFGGQYEEALAIAVGADPPGFSG
jgi:hypothetical protein